MSNFKTRGYRNNNPLNIRISKSKPWKGEVRPSQDISFAQFEDMAWGYRAAFKLLDNYRRLHGCKSLSDFISRWAPPSENDTRKYIETVAKRTHLADVSVLDTTDEYTMRKVVAAMAFVENGVEPDPEEIRQGWIRFRLQK